MIILCKIGNVTINYNSNLRRSCSMHFPIFDVPKLGCQPLHDIPHMQHLNITAPTLLLCWQSTGSTIHRNIRSSNPSQLRSLIIRQIIHSLQSNVETSRRRIHSEDIDRAGNLSRGEAQLVALATVRTVPAGNCWGTSDQWEGGQRAECGVAVCFQAVDAVGAGDCVQGGCAHVVLCVVGDGDCLGGCGVWCGCG